MPVNDVPAKQSMLERLGLHRRELRAWAMYDWAASSAQTTIAVVVFPIYFIAVAGAGRPRGGRIHCPSPMGLPSRSRRCSARYLGTISDYAAVKKRMLVFHGVGVSACALMYLIQRGDLLFASVLFIFANLGMQAATSSTKRSCRTSPGKTR